MERLPFAEVAQPYSPILRRERLPDERFPFVRAELLVTKSTEVIEPSIVEMGSIGPPLTEDLEALTRARLMLSLGKHQQAEGHGACWVGTVLQSFGQQVELYLIDFISYLFGDRHDSFINRSLRERGILCYFPHSWVVYETGALCILADSEGNNRREMVDLLRGLWRDFKTCLSSQEINIGWKLFNEALRATAEGEDPEMAVLFDYLLRNVGMVDNLPHNAPSLSAVREVAEVLKFGEIYVYPA